MIRFQFVWLPNAFSDDYWSRKHVKFHFIMVNIVFYRSSCWSILWHFACRQSGPCVSKKNSWNYLILRNPFQIKICLFSSCWASYWNVPIPVSWRNWFYRLFKNCYLVHFVWTNFWKTPVLWINYYELCNYNISKTYRTMKIHSKVVSY